MKFSLNLAQEFSNVDLKSIPHDEILQKMGAQLGSIEDTTEWRDKYKDIIVAKVVSCEKHPNADKLSLCLVDDGGVASSVVRNEEGYVQVVCGANNVTADIFVAWIPPGATVPSSLDTDPFVLEARELRGKVSNGMIASPKELDISDEHEGILILDEKEIGSKPKPGENFSNYYGLDDYIVDCENKMFTHRPDCFGNLGIARELAGIFGLEFKSPDWYLEDVVFEEIQNDSLNISNSVTDLVSRFTVVGLDNITNGHSPIWMQSYLKRVGIKPISTVVDITNYVMHLTGQPLHAFDYDKLQKLSGSPSLFPRKAKKGEKLTILGGKEIDLDEEDLVISTDKNAVALAGVMGGADTEVDSNTTKILIECANFDMYTIRRTSMRHGLFTDAVTRFNKGQSPLQNDKIINFAIKEFGKLTGAKQSTNVYDLVSFDKDADNLNKVEINLEFINSRLGTELSAVDVKELLGNVEFSVNVQGDKLEITAPFWRMDIAIKEDVVEELGRLYGYDKLPAELPKRTAKPAKRNSNLVFKNEIRNILSSAGANEVLSYSFVHGKLLEQCGIDAEVSAYHLRNALSPELQYYRPSLVPSLLAKIRGNIKAQAGSEENIFALFELGKAHVKEHFEAEEPELPKQMSRLSFVIAADDKTARNLGDSAYYHAKKYLELITGNQSEFDELDTNEYPLTSPYQKERSAVIVMGYDRKPVGVIGEFRQKTKKALKLPEYCAGFEIDTDLLQEHLEKKKYISLSQFPSSSQDITFEVKESTKWEELYILIHAELAVAKAELGYRYEIEPLDIFKSDGSESKRLSMRLTFTHDLKTLKTEEINEVLEQLAKVAHEKLQATRI